jgi:hypothetical protein
LNEALWDLASRRPARHRADIIHALDPLRIAHPSIGGSPFKRSFQARTRSSYSFVEPPAGPDGSTGQARSQIACGRSRFAETRSITANTACARSVVENQTYSLVVTSTRRTRFVSLARPGRQTKVSLGRPTSDRRGDKLSRRGR